MVWRRSGGHRSIQATCEWRVAIAVARATLLRRDQQSPQCSGARRVLAIGEVQRDESADDREILQEVVKLVRELRRIGRPEAVSDKGREQREYRQHRGDEPELPSGR